jgi:hypothetical protein
VRQLSVCNFLLHVSQMECPSAQCHTIIGGVSFCAEKDAQLILSTEHSSVFFLNRNSQQLHGDKSWSIPWSSHLTSLDNNGSTIRDEFYQSNLAVK